MDMGTKVSAIGHGALILWVIVGDVFWPFDTSSQPEVASVSLMSEAEFAALQASAPQVDPSASAAASAPPPPRPAAPVEPPPEVPPELPPEVPEAAQAQPNEAPPPTAPIAEVEQPIPVPPSPIPPAPRPLDRVAATPVDEAPDAPDIADQATPEVSDTAPPDAEVLQTEAPAAAPQEAAPVVVTEADPPPEDAPQLAPTTSIRPQARPARPVPSETPPEDAPDPEADAIAAALAEATATEDAPQADAGADSAAANIPQGPPMTGGEIEGLRIAINRCWVTSTLSTEAMNTTVTLRVELSQDGKPTSIEMTNFEGGSSAAADRAFEAGRRAVMRCAGAEGYDLPADKYDQWNVLNLIFDPNGMRLR
jgi:hypothetical protein